MKRFTAILLFISVFVISSKAENTVCYEKHIHKSFISTPNTKIFVDNSFGNLTIKKSYDDSVRVDIEVESVNNIYRKLSIKTHEFNDSILIKAGYFKKITSKVSKNLRLEVVIQIPYFLMLKVKKHYGTLHINEFSGRIVLDINDVNFTSKHLNLSSLVSPSYIRARKSSLKIDYITGAHIDIEESELSITGKVSALNVKSKYSNVKINKIHLLELESFSDNINIEEIDKINAQLKNTPLTIEKIIQSADISSKEKKLRIMSVVEGFSDIKIRNENANVYIRFSHYASFNFDVFAFNGKILLPARSNASKYSKGNWEKAIGHAGENDDNSGKVKIKVYYGDILMQL